MRNKQRILSLMLAFLMVVLACPFASFAQEGTKLPIAPEMEVVEGAGSEETSKTELPNNDSKGDVTDPGSTEDPEKPEDSGKEEELKGANVEGQSTLADEEQDGEEVDPFAVKKISFYMMIDGVRQDYTVFDIEGGKDFDEKNEYTVEIDADPRLVGKFEKSMVTVEAMEPSTTVSVNFQSPKESKNTTSQRIGYTLKVSEKEKKQRFFNVIINHVASEISMIDYVNSLLPNFVEKYRNTSSDWPTLGMAALGYQDIVNKVALLSQDIGVLSTASSSTDLERVTIALTAMGYDMTYAMNRNGNRLDVIDAISRYQARNVEGGGSSEQGGLGTLNGYIFALIAYDAGNYSDPRGHWNRENVINYIIESQQSNGGWSLASGGTADEDITAMAVQALAPYYTLEKVKVTVDKALVWLEDRQVKTGQFEGAFGSAGMGATGANSNSTVQVILALTALGKDPTKEILTTSGKSPMDGLLAFKTDDGFFGYTNNNSINEMSTEQGFLALISYKKFKENRQGNIYKVNTSPNKRMYQESGPTIVVPRSLTITNYPYKTKYKLNEPMDLAGIELRLEYSDGARRTLSERDVTIYNWDTKTTGYKQALISYNGEIDTIFHYEVADDKPTDLKENLAYISVVDPKGKTYQSKKAFNIIPGTDTAFSLLQKTGLSYRLGSSNQYAGVYVAAIEGWGEFDGGPQSGWMYRVNGSFPNHSASLHTLKAGDYVEWLYTRDLGKDVGGYVDGVEDDDGLGNVTRYVTARAEAGGKIAPSGKVSVSKDKPVTFTITPDTGYVIWDVLQGGVSKGPVSSIAIGSIPKDTTLTATFKKESELTEEEKKELEEKKKAANATGFEAFTDAQNHWAKEAIKYVYEKGYFKGVSNTSFGPNDKMTRGMFVTVLGRMAGTTGEVGTSKFKDVPSKEYYAPFVNWAAKNDIVTGVSETSFDPNAPISREEMATMMDRYMTFKKMTATGTNKKAFKDGGTISSWATESVEKLVSLNVLTGREDGKFDPKNNATRAEVATVIMRLDQLK